MEIELPPQERYGEVVEQIVIDGLTVGLRLFEQAAGHAVGSVVGLTSAARTDLTGDGMIAVEPDILRTLVLNAGHMGPAGEA